MKCAMCGNEVLTERKFELFIPVKDKEDEVLLCCGRCKILCEINDSLKVLVEKEDTVSTPIM